MATKRKRDGDTEDNKDEDSLPELVGWLEFTLPAWKDTATFVIENRKLSVSRHILALVSPVFRTMFNSEFLEQTQKEIPLPEKKFADMVELMKCIYPNIKKPVTIENVWQIIPLADEYQIDEILLECEKCLRSFLKRAHTYMYDDTDFNTELFKILKAADRYNLQKLKYKCLRMGTDMSSEQVKETQKRIQLPSHLLNKLLYRIVVDLERHCNTKPQV